ncbi:MAG: hypothetical protein R2734_01270 [Nocardioides sp.]
MAGLLDELRDRVLLATKGGHVRTEGGWTSTPRRPTSGRPWTAACSGSASSRSRCGSTTGPTRRCSDEEVLGTLGEIVRSARWRWSTADSTLCVR